MIAFRFTRLSRMTVFGAGVLAFAPLVSRPALARVPQPPATTDRPAPEQADAPAPKMGRDGQVESSFAQHHEAFLKRGKEGKIGVLFLGDSITEGWGGAKDVWEAHFGKDDPANFGISGDRTQHVLWRIANGELDGIKPRVLVLMIGTNNIGNPTEEILRGDLAIVNEIHKKLPKTKLLLLGIFPRGREASDPAREKIKMVNNALSKLDRKKNVRYLDIGDKFLDAMGTLPPDIMPDALHPNHKGYEIWADAIQPTLDKMMK